MDSNYISSPTNFHHLEGSESVDLRKTFDLNGSQNDDMLRLYLRKAGLSDEIEYLTPEQHRAFIYDIIKSNKKPGYWLPSTMKSSQYGNRPDIRPPPSPQPSIVSTTMTPFSPSLDRKNDPNAVTLNYASLRSNSSNGSLQSLSKSSPTMPQRFVPISANPSPPSPTTFVTSTKGTRYEISGPMNFQHTAGDMTRDMTRNAFDLSMSSNDNVLKKYMRERGITEEDVEGIRKNDLIRKIVQSKFTWMPSKSKKKHSTGSIDSNLQYATMSRNNDFKLNSPTSSSDDWSTFSQTNSYSPQPSPTGSISKAKIDFSNFSLVAGRFADPASFPSPDDLYGNHTKTASAITTVPLPPLPPEAETPAPPPRKSQIQPQSSTVPPPPSTINTLPNLTENIYKFKYDTDYDHMSEIPSIRNGPPQTEVSAQSRESNMNWNDTNQPTYATVKKPTKKPVLPPPPPPLVPGMKNKNDIDLRPSSASNSIGRNTLNHKYDYLRSATPSDGSVSLPPSVANSSKNSLSSIQSSELMLNGGNVPPPPPPPPPMMNSANVSPQPVVINNKSSISPPPPPPPMGAPLKQNNNNRTKNDTTSIASNDSDGRDALLESIRKGVSLKKIDQKAATISGVKPRSERKPVVNDLLSELKLGVTLRRVKSPDNNPYTSEESHA